MVVNYCPTLAHITSGETTNLRRFLVGQIEQIKSGAISEDEALALLRAHPLLHAKPSAIPSLLNFIMGHDTSSVKTIVILTAMCPKMLNGDQHDLNTSDAYTGAIVKAAVEASGLNVIHEVLVNNVRQNCVTNELVGR